MKRDSFDVQKPTLDLQASCEVSIVPTTSGQVTVEIEASEEDLKTFEVYRRGDTVYVRQAGFNQGSGGVIIIGDKVTGVCQSFSSIGGGVMIGGVSMVTSGRGGNINVVSGGRSVQICDGRVIVDGKDVQDGGGDVVDSQPYKAPKIRIEIPANSNLNAELAGEARLSCIVELNEVSLTCSHRAVVEIDKACIADLDTSNASSVLIDRMTGGVLTINTANGSEVKIKAGEWSQAHVISSNGSAVLTCGNCTGNYNATGNNGSSIRHSGSVRGRVREKANNGSSVRID